MVQTEEGGDAWAVNRNVFSHFFAFPFKAPHAQLQPKPIFPRMN